MIDVESLTAWLDAEELPGSGDEVEVRFLSGGSQNEIYEIRRGELHGALRIPPPSAPETRDDGIWREWRITQALEGTDVPHTPAIAACRDKDVLGRAFYLMGFVDGWSPMEMEQPDGSRPWPEPFRSDLELRKELGFQLIEGIALLSKVDWRGRGLDDLGRPDGFHERQVARWTRFLERIKGREIPGFDEAASWLSRNRPIDYQPGLMHGDYQFANVLFEHGAPARLAAMIDWEMGTIGDPKLDLAHVLRGWPDDTWDDSAKTIAYVDYYGMPSKEELIDRYVELSGRQVDDLDYYLVLANWKFAIVLEQGFQRAGPDDDKLQRFGPLVLDMMKTAADIAESTDYGS